MIHNLTDWLPDIGRGSALTLNGQLFLHASLLRSVCLSAGTTFELFDPANRSKLQCLISKALAICADVVQFTLREQRKDTAVAEIQIQNVETERADDEKTEAPLNLHIDCYGN